LRAVLLCCLLAALTLPPAVAGPQADEPISTDEEPPAEQAPDKGEPSEAKTAGEALPDPPRQMTRIELQRQIDFVQRELEELLNRIGDKDPTPNQRKKLSSLLAQAQDLKKQMSEVEQKTDEKIEEQGTSFKAKWMRFRKAAEDFTSYDVKDGMFRIRFGIRFQFDGLRMYAEGRFFQRIDYRLEWDLAIDNGLKEAWVEGSKWTKFLKWRVGRFKEPYSLARQTSANYLNFLEWPAPVQAIAPGRGWGIMFKHNEAPQRLNWALALTAGGKSATDNQVTSNFTATFRITGLPIYQDQGRTLLHLGGAYSEGSPNGNNVSFSARPEARFAPDYVSTGDIGADKNTVWEVEAAAVFGPFWSQFEWLQSEVPSNDLGDLTFNGSYVEIGWFYTGENRFYQTSDGTFGRVTPNRLFKNGNPFTKKGDCGALEFTARYSALDLNDGAVRGGAMKNYGLGMNWYLSASSEIRLNYIHSDVMDVGGADLVLIRYQFNP
jgi:phosphate-selective porin OprO/OprP